MTQFNAHPEQKSTNEEICGFTVNFLSKCELFTKITLWNEKGELLCMNSGHPGAALKKNSLKITKNSPKELSFFQKLWFSSFYILAIQCHRPMIFQTMNFRLQRYRV